MKKGLAITLSIFLAVALSGCAKKKAVHEEATDAINLDTLETANVSSQTANAAATTPAGVALDATTPQGAVSAAAPVAAEVPTASSSSSPSISDIQTALKNAGMYSGIVNGKSGAKTKAAIKAFQAANSLTADGKVGPKTWSKLGAYLNGQPSATTATEPAAASAPVKTSKTHKTSKSSKRSVSEPPAE